MQCGSTIAHTFQINTCLCFGYRASQSIPQSRTSFSGGREVWFCTRCLEIQKFLLNPQNVRQWPLSACVDCYAMILWDKGTQLGKLLWPSQCQSELAEPSDKLLRLVILPYHTHVCSDHMHPHVLTSSVLVPNLR